MIREIELPERLEPTASRAGMPADKRSKIFRRRRMNDPLACLQHGDLQCRLEPYL